ncbi:MAG: hypothetical protein J6U01_10385 [Clostridia bacterium]|nr:hypothetical protein [Clostridia bacterium]
MKKVITFVLTFVLLVSFVIPFASADESNQRKWRKKFISITRDEIMDAYLAFLSVLDDYDDSYLSSLSYDRLVELKEQINLSIWNSKKWKSIEVPAGVYIVGRDIPAGHWTLKAPVGEYVSIEYFQSVDETGKRPADVFTNYYSEVLADESSAFASSFYVREIDLEMKEGFYLTVINGRTVIFEPFISKPAFSFFD